MSRLVHLIDIIDMKCHISTMHYIPIYSTKFQTAYQAITTSKSLPLKIVGRYDDIEN